MKERLGRIIFAYLARMGLVLCVTDPGAPAVDTTPAPTAAALPEPGAATTDDANPTPPSDGGAPATDTRDPREVELDLIRKEKAKLERRIRKRDGALHDALAREAQLRAQLSGRPQAVNPPPDDNDDDGDPAPSARVDVDALVNERAAELRRREHVATRTTAMLKDGIKLDPEFRTLALDVAADLPFVDPQGRPTEFIEAVLECEKPAALLLYLHRNPDAAKSLEGARGTTLGRRLAAIEAEASKATAVTPKLPKPLAPVGGRGNTEKSESAMSDDEWREHRLKRKA